LLSKLLNHPNIHQSENSKNRIIDFDLHGIVGVRLINPINSDIAAISYQLGLKPAFLSEEPDITIRFKKNIATPGLKYLGLNSDGFTDKEFFLLKSRKRATKVQIPFEKIGSKCEIMCESGLKEIPLLIAIINLTFLKKNFIFLHGGAFVYKNLGILVTGWSKGGKTETLLGFTSHGAKYVADEWTILSHDGQKMFGIAEPVRLWKWQFQYVPQIKRKLDKKKNLLFTIIQILDTFHHSFGKGIFKNLFIFKMLTEAMPALKRQLNIQIQPQELFGKYIYRETATPRKIFFVMSHSESAIQVKRYDSLEIAQRMISSNEYELLSLIQHYKAFKFAFPNLRNEFLENAAELQKTLLFNALKCLDGFQVLHPYPVSLDALFEKMEPFCQK
jgi:hypothetical protein